ncbi:MAG: adenylate/guanylate cyclase domain-containing protein, partial [Myxococcota bacterium]
YLGKEDILQVKLGDCVQQEMNILLCDIHAFTSLSEKMTPQENFRFINDYLKYVEPAVKSQEGFVENYIGDAVSALFHEPHQALEASIRIQQAITQFNTQQHLHVTSGIALHTGSIMLGIVGGMKRMQGMVLSKAILSTFTIQEITSLCQCPIIASEEILNNLQKPEKTDKRFLGYIFQKETNKLMKIHEILHESLENMHSKRKTKHVFENGVKQFFANAFEKAIASFKEVSQEDPKDQAAQLYYKAAKQFLGKQLPQQWNTLQLAEHASSNA